MKMIYFFSIGISTTSIIVGIYWSVAGQQKHLKADTEDTVAVQSEQENNNKSFHNFLPGMLQVQQDATPDLLDSSYVAPTGFDLPEPNGAPPEVNKKTSAGAILHVKNKEEYTRLLSNFTHVEDDEKIKLLEKLWRLAPEVGIDDNLLTLLQLTIYSPDIRVREMASKILSDLQRYKDGELSPEEQLVSQIMEIDNNQQSLTISLGNDEQQVLNQQEFNKNNNTAPSVEVAQQRSEKIEQLTELALNSENMDTKEYALINLVQLDYVSALNIIQHQLLNSKNSDERFKAIEHLRSSIGNLDNNKLRQILEMASNDYDTIISENASNTLEMLDNYLQMQNSPAESDLNRSEIQLNPDHNDGVDGSH